MPRASTAPFSRDTIAAIATPPGRGGIGILRLSGPDALALATPLLRLRAPLQPNHARFCTILDPATDATLDQAVATYYAAPRSYTGEDVLEIAAHGSPVLLDFLLRALTTRGARLANPGEFTERAFLNHRLDLTEAEAVRDLIDAQTLYQARVAAAQLGGALSRRIAPTKAALVALIAQLEAGIDFAEDDTPTLSTAALLSLAEPIATQLAALAHSFEHGRLVHSGLTLAIIGEPNVGKSSLFNRLVERERAIVTAAAGTTRDLVTERISLAGIPVELVDTAGLRDAASGSGSLDEAERIGIGRSQEALADADLVLVVLDASRIPPASHFPEEESAEPRPSPRNPNTNASTRALDTALQSLDEARTILVLNKCDLFASAPNTAPELASVTTAEIAPDDRSTVDPPVSQTSTPPMKPALLQIPQALLACLLVHTSAITGDGLPALREAITRHLQAPAVEDQTGLITNLRQHQAVTSAEAAMQAAIAAAPLGTPDEMLLLDLYAALAHLDSLTGATTSDDVLHLIFSTFCIGK